MKKLLAVVFLSIPVLLSAQVTHTEGKKTVYLGIGFTRYNPVINAGMNYFLNKNAYIGGELYYERGKIGLTKVSTFLFNENFNYNVYRTKLHQYRHIFYYLSALQLAGIGNEHIKNEVMKMSNNRIVYNLGLGINNEVYWENISVGLRFEQRFLLRSKLGAAYWLIIPEVKYNF